jgi:hypothetical protein
MEAKESGDCRGSRFDDQGKLTGSRMGPRWFLFLDHRENADHDAAGCCNGQSGRKDGTGLVVCCPKPRGSSVLP